MRAAPGCSFACAFCCFGCARKGKRGYQGVALDEDELVEGNDAGAEPGKPLCRGLVRVPVHEHHRNVCAACNIDLKRWAFVVVQSVWRARVRNR